MTTPTKSDPQDAATSASAAGQRLRCGRDRQLADGLLSEPTVERALSRLHEEESKGLPSVRRSLFARAVRLAPSIAPEVAEVAAHCEQTLGLTAPLETFVYPSPDFNAAAVRPEAGRLFVLLSSSLLEAFSRAELAFVMGHELGHHVFGHHEIPLGAIFDLAEPPPPNVVLRLFAWSRYAEVSADRAGAACANDPDASARALFRLASGLHGPLSRVGIDVLADQAAHLRLEDGFEGAPRSSERDWFSTHPYSPLRLEALRLFHRSELFVVGGLPTPQRDASVEEAMSLMEPSYLEEHSDVAEVMRRVLFAGAVAIARANGEISEAERDVLEHFFGRAALDPRLDVDAVVADLSTRTRRACAVVPHARRVQVLRDLVLVARADGVLRAPEVALLRRIADELEIADSLTLHALCERCEID